MSNCIMHHPTSLVLFLSLFVTLIFIIIIIKLFLSELVSFTFLSTSPPHLTMGGRGEVSEQLCCA